MWIKTCQILGTLIEKEIEGCYNLYCIAMYSRRLSREREKMMHQAGVYEKYIKRGLDLLLSGGALLLLWPVLLVLGVLVRAKLGSPAIFCQERPGKNGKVFRLYKLRSMTEERDENGELLPDDVRLTKFGKLLRSTSLDELPQLLNVLAGNLSLVGPRPVVQEELERYGDNQQKFLRATPGLTGYWQAYARSTCTYEQRMEMELFYADHANLWWDIKILFATVGIVLQGKGAK